MFEPGKPLDRLRVAAAFEKGLGSSIQCDGNHITSSCDTMTTMIIDMIPTRSAWSARRTVAGGVLLSGDASHFRRIDRPEICRLRLAAASGISA
jgi:hypothetical protein